MLNGKLTHSYRSYSPNSYVLGSPLQRVGTKKDGLLSPEFDGKIFVGKAVEIAGGNSLDCQRSCQRDFNCISWTWNKAGGLNPETCVHNYGRTERKLGVPAVSKIVSGSKYCKNGKEL